MSTIKEKAREYFALVIEAKICQCRTDAKADDDLFMVWVEMDHCIDALAAMQARTVADLAAVAEVAAAHVAIVSARNHDANECLPLALSLRRDLAAMVAPEVVAPAVAPSGFMTLDGVLHSPAGAGDRHTLA